MKEPMKVQLVLPATEAMQLEPGNWSDVLRWLRDHDIECGSSEDGRYLWLKSDQHWPSLYDGDWIVCTPSVGFYGVRWQATYYSRETAFNELYRPEGDE